MATNTATNQIHFNQQPFDRTIMKTKEELKSTFIRYSHEITKDVFKRIIDKIEQLGFKQYSTCNNYEDFVSNCLVLSGEYVWYIINEYGMNKRPEIEVSDILGDGWRDVEQKETKTVKNKYVEYNKDFTEDMFDYMLDWAKKQNHPYPPYYYCANTFYNFKTKGYFWFGCRDGYSYGVDNNPQDFDEITFEELFPEYNKPEQINIKCVAAIKPIERINAKEGWIYRQPELDDVTVELIDVPDI